MEKKLYIQPTIKTFHIKPLTIICGSGGATGSLPSGSVNPPTPSEGGVITTESISDFGIDFNEDNIMSISETSD